jgi:adenylylsulfate kinase
MKKIKKNKGIVFWITGLSGSGKTTIAEKIKKKIISQYGASLTFSGDDLRKLFNYNQFSKEARLTYAMSYGKFCKYISDKNINVIFSTVSLFDEVRRWNRSNINNYIEIYIKSDIKKLMKKRQKFFYKGNHKNIVGKNLKAEFPKKPNITIKNDFTKPLNKLSKELIKKILVLC